MKIYLKALNILVVVFFLSMLLLPSLNETFHFIIEEKGNENRTKTAKPEFDYKHLDKYVKDYDNYYTDNFNLRDNFIKLLNKLEFLFFKVSSVPDIVLIGKDGWFYESSCALNYKGANHFTDEEIKKFRNELINRTQWAANRGIKYYLVVIPNKMNIYPEHLPNQIIKTSDISRYDQIVNLNNDSTIHVIDVKKNLLSHKKDDYDIYQHTDDHWNELGAYYGYQEIMNRLSKDFPELKPIPLTMFDIGVEQRYGNMASMINVEKDYPEQFVKLTPKFLVYGHDGTKKGYKTLPQISEYEYEIVKENNHGKKLKCLIIRDSFTMLMISFFQECFAKCVIVHDQWMYRMREDLILKEKPDIILDIALETRIHSIIGIPFQLSANQKLEQNVYIKAANDKYFCTESPHTVIANRDNPSTWETYMFISYDNDECAFLSHDNFFLSANLVGKNEVTASAEMVSDSEKFKIIHLDNDFVAFKAANGKYIRMDEKSRKIYANADTIGVNEKFKLEAVK